MLERIVAGKRDEVSQLTERRTEVRRAAEHAGAARPFAASLARRGEVSVIAEYKRRSPSAGDLGSADPVSTALSYERGGAAAISVLTDGPNFGGRLADLTAVHGAVAVPVLRKDFVLDEVQVWESRAAGADAVLLIARILDDGRLAGLIELCRELSFSSLVEIHDEEELDRALRAGAGVIGINNRDLDRFVTDLNVTLSLAERVPGDRILVSESGVRNGDDVTLLGEAGADAVLVGEALMRGGPEGVTALTGHAKRERDPGPVWRASSC